MRTKNRVRMTGIWLVALLALLLAFLPARTVWAAENTGDIGFYVRAVLPENQIDNDLTYFDLRMQPGQTQTLEVEVVNETDEAITVDIDIISASTNRNGVIDYKTPDIRDITLQNPFSELAEAEKSELAIPAQGRTMARIIIDMPAQEYDGIVLGVLVFTRKDDALRQNAEGASLQNLYSYVIGVKLSENEVAVLPDFELESIQSELVNYQPALVHHIRNKNAAIAKNVDVHVILHDAAGQVVGEATRIGIHMAPNSVMPLAITPLPAGEAEQSTGGGGLQPGSYSSEVTLSYGGKSWIFVESFTIGRTEADAINNQAVGAAPPPGGQMIAGTWLVILLIAAVIILGLLVIILLMRQRRKEIIEQNRKKRQHGKRLRLRKEQQSRDD